MNYFIIKAILAMCSLNMPSPGQPRLHCVKYMIECIENIPGFSEESDRYIQCQFQYMTIYNSYASSVCPTYEQLKEQEKKD